MKKKAYKTGTPKSRWIDKGQSFVHSIFYGKKPKYESQLFTRNISHNCKFF